jgi:EAL domain-containing protein (putative c-di-GMP-specific phosphodiesterase class I)
MRDQGLDVGVSVNLSSTSLRNEDVVDQIVTALTTYDLMPESLSVEITEDAVVDNDEKTLEILNQIRDMGVRLSIDDFGTGYSSLSYLKRLPVRELKIDRAFIRDLPDDETVRSIVISIVGMCRGMGVSTVAEGVEDMTQYQMATNVGCDYVQGYLITQPLCEKDVIEFLKQAPAYPTRAATVSSAVSKAS